jgi:hypothetical protein
MVLTAYAVAATTRLGHPRTRALSRSSRSTECTTTAGRKPRAEKPAAIRKVKGPAIPIFGSSYAGSAQRFQIRPSIAVPRSNGSNRDVPAARLARSTMASNIAYSTMPVLKPTRFKSSLMTVR